MSFITNFSEKDLSSSSLSREFRLFSLALACVVYVILTGQSAFWTYVFWTRRHDFGFHSRRSDLMLTYLSCALVWMATRIAAIFFWYFDMLGSSKTTALWLVNSTDVITSITVITGTAIFCLRVWLIFYDCSLAVENADFQWIKLVTDEVCYFPKVLGLYGDLTAERLLPSLHPSQPDEIARSAATVFLPSLRSGGGGSVISKQRSFWKSHSLISVSLSTSVHRSTLVDRRMSRSRHNSSVQQSRHQFSGDQSTSWFLNARYTWGNEQWLRQKLMITLPLLIALVATFNVIEDLQLWGLLTYWVFFFMVVSLFTVMVVRFPVYTDSLRVIDEMRALSKVAGLGILAIIGAVIVYFTAPAVVALCSNVIALSVGWAFILIETKFLVINFPDPSSEDSTHFWVVMRRICGILTGIGRRVSKSKNTDGERLQSKDIKSAGQAYLMPVTPRVTVTHSDQSSNHKTFSRSDFADESMVRRVGDISLLGVFCNDCVYDWCERQSHTEPANRVKKTIRAVTVDSGRLAGRMGHVVHLSTGVPIPVSPDGKGNNECALNGPGLTPTPEAKITVKDFLREENGFRAFMAHLFSEFAYENLLAIIELTQFVELMKSVIEKEKSEELDKKITQFGMEQTDLIPHGIVHIDDGDQKMEEQDSKMDEKDRDDEEKAEVYEAVEKALTLSMSDDHYDKTDSFRMLSNCDAVLASTSPTSLPIHPPQPEEMVPTLSDLKDFGSDSLTKRITLRARNTVREFMGSFDRLLEFAKVASDVETSITHHPQLSKEQKFVVLYQKYFANDAEYCVNVSHNTRKKLKRIAHFLLSDDLGNVTLRSEDDVYNLIDEMSIERAFVPAIRELLRLLRDSFGRFRSTDAYERCLPGVIHARDNRPNINALLK